MQPGTEILSYTGSIPSVTQIGSGEAVENGRAGATERLLLPCSFIFLGAKKSPKSIA